MEAYMYVGKQVTSEVLRDLLAMNSLEEAGVGPSSKPISLPILETRLSKTTNALMDEVRVHGSAYPPFPHLGFLRPYLRLPEQIRQNRCTFMRLRIIKRSDPLEPVFFNLLLEDRSTSGMSYVEFLCHIHRQIQNQFA